MKSQHLWSPAEDVHKIKSVNCYSGGGILRPLGGEMETNGGCGEGQVSFL